MDRILDFIIEIIEKNDEVNDEEKEVIRYGLELIFLKTLFWILVTIVGIVMGCFWESAAYNLMFFALRSYAGGYHAKTRTRCLIQSMLTVAVALTVIKICRDNVYLTALLAVMALTFGIALWLLAPVDTENRRLDNEEVKRFRLMARVVLSVEAAVGIAAYCIGYMAISCAAMAAIATGGILILAEFFKKGNAGKYE